jgi:hypothetical protein
MDVPSDVALPTPTLTPGKQRIRIKITRTEANTANFATALLAMKQRSSSTYIEAMALDTECDTRQKASGMINWSGLLEVLQIGYDDNGIKLAWLIHLKKISKLPVALRTLLASCHIKFVGVNVGVDMKALEKKYRRALGVNTVTFGVIARDCNAVMDGRVGLKELSGVVLNENMSKDTNVRCSTRKCR